MAAGGDGTGNGMTVRRFQHGSRVPGWDEAADLEKDPSPVPEPATTEVPGDLRAQIDGYMARYPDRRSAVIPALAAAQRLHGWCSPEAMEQVASVMRLTPGYVASIATFYDMLETQPVGAHDVFVCTNISCSMRGADQVYEAMCEAVADDAAFNVRSFECLGACDLAPMASVDGVYVGPLEAGDVERIVEDVGAGRPVLPDKQLRCRPSADPHANERDFPAPTDTDGAHQVEAGAAVPAPDPERMAVGPEPEEPTGGEQPASDHGEHEPFIQPERRQGKS